MERVRAVLYTKKDCSLCEKMKDQMAQANCLELYTLEEVDIEADPELFTRYKFDIPVLSLNGVEAFRHRLSADEFRAYVTALSQTA